MQTFFHTWTHRYSLKLRHTHSGADMLLLILTRTCTWALRLVLTPSLRLRGTLMWTHSHRHTLTHSHTQADTHTHTDTDTHRLSLTQTHTDKHTFIHTLIETETHTHSY